MAGSRMGMAESTVRLLIADAATVPRASATGLHHHAFWQLDHCAAGSIDAELPAGAVRLRVGQGMLVPPGLRHGFRYPPGARYVSWKFTWDGGMLPGSVRLAQQAGWAGLAAALAAAPVATAVPYLLAAALRIAGAPPPEAGFAAEVARLVEAHPARSWSVAAVASSLGLSPGHASARFRSERGLTLKTWLDTRRAEHVARMLRGSGLSVADIAAVCTFADPFALSRFFRRVTGDSPTAFRARRG